MVAIRKSSWLKAYQSACLIFGLSNGLCSQFGRNTNWALSCGDSTTVMFGSFLSVPSRSWLGCSRKSSSPFCSALTACCWSEMASHSTRSTLTTLPPARPDAGSDRGLYLSNFTYTVLSPGFHSSLTNTNGPEPVKSSICLVGSVSATRFGIMKGTFDDGLDRPSSTRPVGSLSWILKDLASTGVIELDKGHHLLTHRIARAPALDRRDAIVRHPPACRRARAARRATSAYRSCRRQRRRTSPASAA